VYYERRSASGNATRRGTSNQQQAYLVTPTGPRNGWFCMRGNIATRPGGAGEHWRFLLNNKPSGPATLLAPQQLKLLADQLLADEYETQIACIKRQSTLGTSHLPARRETLHANLRSEPAKRVTF
jgi:hypothetical protein